MGGVQRSGERGGDFGRLGRSQQSGAHDGNDDARTFARQGLFGARQNGGAYAYSPQHEHETQLRGVVGRFIEKTLGGSLDPFVAYLGETELTPAQKSQLRGLVEKLDETDGEKEGK